MWWGRDGPSGPYGQHGVRKPDGIAAELELNTANVQCTSRRLPASIHAADHAHPCTRTAPPHLSELQHHGVIPHDGAVLRHVARRDVGQQVARLHPAVAGVVGLGRVEAERF